MRISKDELGSLLLFIVMLFYFLSSFSIMTPSFMKVAIQPDQVPQFIAIAGMIVSAIIFYGAYKKRKSIESEATNKKEEKIKINKPVLIRIFSISLVVFIYGWVFRTVGYIISTIFLYLIVSIILGGEWKKSLVIGIILSVLVFVLFSEGIGVNLPSGWLSFIFE